MSLAFRLKMARQKAEAQPPGVHAPHNWRTRARRLAHDFETERTRANAELTNLI